MIFFYIPAKVDQNRSGSMRTIIILILLPIFVFGAEIENKKVDVEINNKAKVEAILELSDDKEVVIPDKRPQIPMFVTIKREAGTLLTGKKICKQFESGYFYNFFNKNYFVSRVTCQNEANSEGSFASILGDYIAITLTLKKRHYYTVVLDLASVVAPFIPMFHPQWGQFIYDLEVILRLDGKKSAFEYNVESDFSYLIYPLFRTDQERNALNRGIYKMMDLLDRDQVLRGTLSQGIFKPNIDTIEPERSVIVEERSGLIQRDHVNSMIGIAFRRYWGETTVDGYYDDNGTETLGASGEGTVKEYKIQASSINPTTGIYISPNVGFFYRDIAVSDFGQDVSYLNRGKEGFVGGITTDYDTGEQIDVSSLSYNAEFYSMSLGVKGGFNLVMGDQSLQWTLRLDGFLNLIEMRYGSLDSGTTELSEWSFPYLSSYGLALEAGLFFPHIRTGIRVIGEFSWFRRFSFGKPVEFRSMHYDYEKALYVEDVIEIESYDISTKMIAFDIYYLF